MWLPIHTAPFEAEIELAVIDRGGPHVLIFPCRQALQGFDQGGNRRETRRPSHWRPWVRWQSLDRATMVSPLNEIATEMV
jgi:hypothetical protein